MGLTAPVTCLRAARLFTAASDAVIADGAVAIQGSSVVAAGPVGEVLADRPDETVIDLGDVTILPGLVDAHVHVTLPADRRPYEHLVLDSDELMALIALRNLQIHLLSGVTTVRDNGGRNRVTFVVREAIERGYFVGPRMLVAGRPLTPTLGHLHWCNGTADGFDAIRATVRQLVAEGADHIKIVASGGATKGNAAFHAAYDEAEMRVAVDTAHRLDRLTTAHCRSTDSMLSAVAAGLDCIEHAEFLAPPGTDDGAAHAFPFGTMCYDPAVTERILASDTFVSYTLQGGLPSLDALRATRERRDLGAAEQAELALLDRYVTGKLEILECLLADGMGPKLVLSSDAGPWDNVFGRMDYAITAAVESGVMGAAQALLSVTRTAAEACGMADQVGTLEPGKEADLLVVRGDPFSGIRAVTAVEAVYKAGVRLQPGSVVSDALVCATVGRA